TTLVEGLLQGPTAQLQGAVNTAAPTGLQLDVSVSVSQSGLAVVPLSGDLLSDTDRQLFAAQLAWTLRQIPTIRRVQMTVDGAPVAEGTAAGTGGGVEAWLRGAAGIMRPSWDVRDVLWVVDDAPAAGGGSVGPRPQQVIVMTKPGSQMRATAPWLGPRMHIEAFSVSRDGVRFAAIVR